MTFRTCTLITVAVAIVALLLFSSMYVVDVTEHALVLQFGKVVETRPEPGLYFKRPFIQGVEYIDKRLREWDGEPSTLMTKEKQKIEVNTFARWHVSDPKQFYLRLTSETRGQSVLDGQIESSVKNVATTYSFMEILRSTARELKYTSAELAEAEAERNIVVETGREKIVLEILAGVKREIEEEYGLVVDGLGIKQLNYVREVIPKIHERMRAERDRIANLYESEGRELEAKIVGEMTKELEKIESEGKKLATIIRGQADAEALKIYAEAYGKDPEFYAFLRSLETLKLSMTDKVRLVLGTSGPLLRYLKEFGAEK
jgi:membrane protease subunit HflC